MTFTTEAFVTSTGRKLPFRARPDLTVRRQRFQGEVSYTVKEPLARAYAHLTEEEFALFQMLDGSCSLDDMKQRFERQFPHRHTTVEELLQFVASLHRRNLVLSDAAHQGLELKRRGRERRRQELLSKLGNVLALRFRGVDPRPLLDWLYPKVRWAFSPAALAAGCLLAVSAVLLVLLQFESFSNRLPAFHEFFSPLGVGWLAATLCISKLLHELGHGLTCKHFGGQCRQIGLMLLVFTPCLYCDVSDSWMLRSKWQRAAIGAAGMCVEITLASLCTIIWWFTEPGLLNHLCLYVMFTCSLSTLLVNANPLLRFDGYYILSDLLEVPNLRQKASSLLLRMLSAWCLGIETPQNRDLPPRRHIAFILYAIAAPIYGWVVLFVILWFLAKVLEPYRLEIVGELLAIAAVVGLVASPAWRMGKFFRVPGMMRQINPRRAASCVCVVGALLAVILFVPLPYHVVCPLEIAAYGARPVYVEVPGRLRTVYVRAGERVAAGSKLAEMENLELEEEIAQLAETRNQQQARLKTLSRQRFHEPQALAQMRPARDALEATQERLSKRLADHAKLTLRAPCDGEVLPPPALWEPPGDDTRPHTWSGTPLDAENIGAFLRNKTLYCQVGDTEDVQAVLVVDQADIEFVHGGQFVELKLDERPFDQFEGQITSVARSRVQSAPLSLSTKAGGSLATMTDPSGIERPRSAAYQAQVLISDERGLWRLGLRGTAKIHTGQRTLAQRFWRYLARTFRFDL